MLDQAMKDQLKAYLENLKTDVHLVLSLDDSDTSNKLQALANDIASLNDKVKVIEDQSASARKPIMQVVNPTKKNSYRFCRFTNGSRIHVISIGSTSQWWAPNEVRS